MGTTIREQLSKTSPLTESLVVAHLWLGRGYRIVPCQPGTKEIAKGYGPHQSDLKTPNALEYWFRARNANIAVICSASHIVLDFDDPGVYFAFCEKSPEIALSYTEQTPRGGYHLFLAGENGFVPRWGKIIKGLEIKQLVLVYPSDVQGKQYKIITSSKILTVNLEKALQGFAEVLAINEPDFVESSNGGNPVAKRKDDKDKLTRPLLISSVKSRWPILLYLATFEPSLKLVGNGNGRYFKALCPWHDDHEPSLWVDTQLNIWGCFGCAAHGDVINWHELKYSFAGQGLAARDLANYQFEAKR